MVKVVSGRESIVKTEQKEVLGKFGFKERNLERNGSGFCKNNRNGCSKYLPPKEGMTRGVI